MHDQIQYCSYKSANMYQIYFWQVVTVTAEETPPPSTNELPPESTQQLVLGDDQLPVEPAQQHQAVVLSDDHVSTHEFELPPESTQQQQQLVLGDEQLPVLPLITCTWYSW